MIPAPVTTAPMTTAPMITARPIRFTDHLAAHRRILEALGGRLLTDAHGWVEYAVGSGRVGLHDAGGSDERSGHTRLGWVTPDLQGWQAAATAAGLDAPLGQEGHGPAARVTNADGTWFTVDSDTDESPTEHTPPAPFAGTLAVLQIWGTPDTEQAHRVVKAVGAKARIVGDDGVWTDYSCDGGGLAAVHLDETAYGELAYWFSGDLEELATALEAAGVEAALIDESYSRTLQIADPDVPGATIWVNEQQHDLYGYRRLD